MVELRRRVIEIVRQIQLFPYIWPTPPDATSARTLRAGSCASKHALLVEELEALGVRSQPMLVIGPLVPPILAHDPDIAPGAHLAEVHECLTVMSPWAGPLRVDVTWDPPLIGRGLAGTLDWDGLTDMLVAVGERQPAWAVTRDVLREAKEALRARLYQPGEREIRDRALQAMAKRFASWRSTDGSIPN
jgi:hypothetical protein